MPSPEIEVCLTSNTGHSEAPAGLPLLTRLGHRRSTAFNLGRIACQSCAAQISSQILSAKAARPVSAGRWFGGDVLLFAVDLLQGRLRLIAQNRVVQQLLKDGHGGLGGGTEKSERLYRGPALGYLVDLTEGHYE